MTRALTLAAAVALLASCSKPTAGTEGPQGPAGANGMTGPQGPQGPQGPDGPQGPPGQVLVVDGGVLVGPAGPRGASVLVTPIAPGAACPTGGVRVALEDGGMAQVVCNGATGAAGPAGPSGAAGPAGPSASVTAIDGGACPNGGVQLQTDAGIVSVCNGAAGPAGPQGPSGGVGPPGPPGGTGGGTGSNGASGGFSFAGFTTAAFNGNLGGPVGANAKCDAQFSGSHLCTIREYIWTGSSTGVPAAGAWVEYASYPTQYSPALNPRDRGNGDNCNDWRDNTTANYGGYLDLSGLYTTGSASTWCPTARPLACCRAQTTWFRGFTAASFNGNLGGPVGANAKCHLEFSGSHLCTIREYIWTGSPLAVPSGGAWVDYASYPTQYSPDLNPRDRGNGDNCNDWRDNTTANYGGYLDTSGLYTTGSASTWCPTARPLSCCGG